MTNFLISLVCSIFLKVTLSLGQSFPTEKCTNGQKLCFSLPANCITSSSVDCQMLVLISSKANSEDGLDVDVYGKGSRNTYYALGFVRDHGMSGATVVHCNYNSDSTFSVGEGVTQGYQFVPLSDRTLTQTTSAGTRNGLIHCHWTQKSKGLAESGDSSVRYNLADRHYVQLAQGTLIDGNLLRHSFRSITDETINLRSVGIQSSSSVPLLIRIHGSLMTLAWLCLVTISMIIARYHKDSWGDKTICNVKVWFALHRAFMVSALLLATIGMISIFVHVKGWRADTPHQYFGLFANIIMFLQPLGALLRPDPDHPKRFIFNIGHFLAGHFGHILAIIALFFVLSLSSVALSKAYVWLLVIFLIVDVSTHLILQFHPHLLTTFNLIGDIQMNDLKNQANNLPSSSPVIVTIERSKKRVLTISMALMIALNIIIVIFINMASPS